MKYLLGSLVWLVSMLGLTFGSYAPTSVDQQLVSSFSAKITTMYQQNPTKVQAIAPKLEMIVWLYSDDTRIHYVLHGLHMHIMSLLNSVSTTTTTVAAPTPTPVPVVTPPTVTTNNNYANNDGSMVSYVAAGQYADPDVQDLWNLYQNAHIKWNPDAQFIAFKFSDFECPTCQRYSLAKTADALIDHYNGQVNYVLTHLKAGDYHTLAQKAAEAAECVWAQWWSTAYYAFESDLFLWDPSRDRIESSFDYISNGNLDKQAFLSCLDNDTMKAKVENTRSVWLRLWATWTPTHVFLDSNTGQYVVLQGAISVDSWIDVISWLPGWPQ